MKKIIASLLIVSMTVFSTNISCYAETKKQKSLCSETKNIMVTYTPEEQEQMEETIRSVLLELSKDKEFMDSLIKNYKDSTNKSQQTSFLHGIKKLSCGGLKWIVKKIIGFFTKILGICIGTTAAGFILWRMCEKTMKNITGSSFLVNLLSKFFSKKQ